MRTFQFSLAQRIFGFLDAVLQHIYDVPILGGDIYCFERILLQVIELISARGITTVVYDGCIAACSRQKKDSLKLYFLSAGAVTAPYAINPFFLLRFFLEGKHSNDQIVLALNPRALVVKSVNFR